MFTLIISVWWCPLTLIHKPNIPIPMHYCLLQHQSLLSSPDTSIAEGHFYFVPASSFFVESLLCFSWSSILDAYWPRGLIFWCLFVCFLSCHTVHCPWGKNMEVVCHFFLWLNPHFDITLLHDLSILSGPSSAKGIAQCFIELLRLWSMWPS